MKHSFLLLAISMVCFSACSKTETAGNSAEIGNPEIATLEGSLFLNNHKPAKQTIVHVVPEHFNAFEDSLSGKFSTRTDSLGFYRIDSLPSGKFTLEAFDASSGYMLLTRGLSGSTDSVYSDVLMPPGTLRIPLNSYKDGDSVTVNIPGTTIIRKVKVKYGEILIDSLPVSLLKNIIINEDTLFFENPVFIQSEITSKAVDSALSFSVKYPLSGISIEQDFYDMPIVLRLDSSDISFDFFKSISGAWTVSRNNQYLKMQNIFLDSKNKQASFWILLDTLKKDQTDTLVLTFKENEVQPNLGNVFRSIYNAAYHFDEGIVLAEDASGNGNTLIPENVTDTSGVIGKAFYYDGRTSFATLPASCDGLFNFNPIDTFAFSVWVKPADFITSRVIFSKGTNQYFLKYYHPKGYLFEKQTEDAEQEQTLRYMYYSDAPFDSVSFLNTWTMLTVVQQDSTVQLYVNGDLVTDEPKIGIYSKDSLTYYRGNDFEVGRRTYPAKETSDQYFHGFIDELFAFNVFIDSAYIQLAYKNQKPENYWPKPISKNKNEQ